MITARPIVADDAVEACTLLNEIIRIGGTTAFQTELSVVDFANHYITGDDLICCHVALDEGGQVAGFQWLGAKDTLPEGCGDIATFARQSNPVRGIGSALFAATTAAARTKGLTQINAKIRADNTPGLGYYSKMGFVDHDVARAQPLSDGTLVDRITKRFIL
ncbi:MAG: N-acetyltransferase family protein [Sedimentitalea sp.]